MTYRPSCSNFSNGGGVRKERVWKRGVQLWDVIKIIIIYLKSKGRRVLPLPLVNKTLTYFQSCRCSVLERELENKDIVGWTWVMNKVIFLAIVYSVRIYSCTSTCNCYLLYARKHCCHMWMELLGKDKRVWSLGLRIRDSIFCTTASIYSDEEQFVIHS